MLLRRVRQDHHDGCFVACIAMLLGVTYLDAFKIVHPDRALDEYGYGFAGIQEIDIARAAFDILKRLNLNPKRANVQEIRRLRRLSVVLIRWRCSPTLLHAVVFDPKNKTILDPSSNYPNMKDLSEQMEAAFYVEAA